MKNSLPQRRAMLSVFSANRVGIAKRVTRFLLEHRANVVWMHGMRERQEEREVFRLDCCFAAAPRRLHAIEGAYLPILADLRPRMTTIASPHCVSIVALDQEGIVAEATSILARFDCDILMLKANSFNAPMCGRYMFELEIAAEFPLSLDQRELQEAFDRVACQRTWHVAISKTATDALAEGNLAAGHRQLMADDEMMCAVSRN